VAERKPHLQYIKTFVPLFPWLYQTLNKGSELGNRKLLTLAGEQIVTKSSDPNDFELVHPKAQIKFSVRGDVLLKYEETRQKEVELQ